MATMATEDIWSDLEIFPLCRA